jgi:hypothetical protein
VCFLQLRKWNAAVKVCNELLEKHASSVAGWRHSAQPISSSNFFDVLVGTIFTSDLGLANFPQRRL